MPTPEDVRNALTRWQVELTATMPAISAILDAPLPGDPDPVVSGTVTCGEREASCMCVKPRGHVEGGDPVHGCDAGCGGSWTWVGGRFVPVTFPSGVNSGLPT